MPVSKTKSRITDGDLFSPVCLTVRLGCVCRVGSVASVKRCEIFNFRWLNAASQVVEDNGGKGSDDGVHWVCFYYQSLWTWQSSQLESMFLSDQKSHLLSIQSQNKHSAAVIRSTPQTLVCLYISAAVCFLFWSSTQSTQSVSVVITCFTAV